MLMRWTLIAAMSAALAAAPVGLSNLELTSQALAKNEGGGGNAGGNSGNAPGRDGTPGNSGHANTGQGMSLGNSGRFDTNRGQAARPSDIRDRTQSARDVDLRNGDRARTEARTKAANELGNLNAAHASANARANASPNSMVGRIATYETQMLNALQIQDLTQRNAAITAARGQLAQSANKPLTESAITRVDGLLGIQGAPPQLGAVR
jgi:hypothetical protein